jgi:imidazolonepropionase-like amidohydrolase
MRGLRMVILVLALMVATQGTAQTAPPATLIKAAHLIDPRTASTLSPAAVLIEDGKIERAGAPTRVQEDAPATVKVVDDFQRRV